MTVTTDTTETPQSDTPPRRRRRTSSPAPDAPDAAQESSGKGAEGKAASPPPRRPRATSLEGRLNEWIGAIAIPYATVGDQWAADLITERGPGIAKAWADLAQQNPAVKRVLEKMMQTSAWGAVIVSSASLIIPILAHHGILPLPYDPFGSGPIPLRGGSTKMPEWSDQTRPEQPRSPIITPPPVNDMTPPVAPGAPPGVFTVAGSSNGATMPAGAE